MEINPAAISFLVHRVHCAPVIIPNLCAPQPALSDAEASDETPCTPGNANLGDSTIGVQHSSCIAVLICSTSSAISPDTMAQSCSHVRYLALDNSAYAELSMVRTCKRKLAQKVNLLISVATRVR